MKKITTINIMLMLSLMLSTASVFAQKKSAAPISVKTTVEGYLNGTVADQSIRLTQFEGTASATQTDDKGHFNFEFLLTKPGFYILDQVGEVYLSPGDHLNVKMDKDSSYRFSGKGSEANAIFSSLKPSLSEFLPYNHRTGFKPEVYQMDERVLLQKLAAFEDHSKKRLSAVPDPFFREIAMKDLEYFDNRLLWTYVRGYAKGEKATVGILDSAVRKQIENRVFHAVDPNQVNLFQNSQHYRTAVEEKILFMMYARINQKDARNKELKILAQRDIAREIVSEKQILDQLNCGYTIALLKAASPLSRRDSIYNAYIAGHPSLAHKAAVEQIYRRQLDYGDNGSAPDFDYADVNGKRIQLSGLKGKYVYIDIWATWCGPCKAQIPFLAKLEEDYKDKNIQFLSISIDELKDQKKWADFVKEEQLGGIQVMADNAFKSEFIQKFNINAIPRFILIDPKGKIVSANAKRPSDPELREQLGKLL